MYCTRCGLKLDDEDFFCSKCGTAARSDAPPRAESRRRHLVRPMAEKKIAGVCAGFARYFEVDPTLVRIIWLVAALAGGAGFLAYIVAWIAMPKAETLPPLAAT